MGVLIYRWCLKSGLGEITNTINVDTLKKNQRLNPRISIERDLREEGEPAKESQTWPV